MFFIIPSAILVWALRKKVYQHLPFKVKRRITKRLRKP